MRKTFRERYLEWKKTGILPYEAGRPIEQTDAVRTDLQQRQSLTQSVQNANETLRLAMIQRAQTNPTLVSADTRTSAERQRVHQQATVDRERYRRELLKQKAEEGFWKLMSLTSPSTYIGLAVGRPLNVGESLVYDAAILGGFGALRRGLLNVAKKASVALNLRNPKVAEDFTELTPKQINITPSAKQPRIVAEDTYPWYTGPRHSVSEVVNPDGTVNPRTAMKILHEVVDRIPGAYRMEHRLENPEWHVNDPTTFHHTRDVALRAWLIPTPTGYTKQDQMIAALGHDFGKMISGDGHAKTGASLLEQVFPDITESLLAAVREHMSTNPADPLSAATKQADIGFPQITASIAPSERSTINLEKPLNNIINRFVTEKSIPYSELQAFKNSTLERMADARGITDPLQRQKFIQNGMSKVGTRYNLSSLLNYSRAEGMADPLTGTITIKPGSEEFALGHEMRHRLDYAQHWAGDNSFTLTPEEYGMLRSAYTGEFLDFPVDYPMLLEMVTTNADVRKQLLGKLALKDLSVAKQNAKIDAATGTDVLNALKNANAYGDYYYRALVTNPIYREDKSRLMIDILKKIKTAMKNVGGLSIPVVLTASKPTDDER